MYAVIIRNSFDSEIPVFLFGTEQEAVARLRELWEKEASEEKLLDFNVDAYVSADGWYGKITTIYPDHECVTEYNIGMVKG